MKNLLFIFLRSDRLKTERPIVDLMLLVEVPFRNFEVIDKFDFAVFRKWPCGLIGFMGKVEFDNGGSSLPIEKSLKT